MLLSSKLITLETSRRVDEYADHGDHVSVTLENGERAEGRALIAVTDVVENPRPHCRRRQAARLGHILTALCSGATRCAICGKPDVVLWAGPRCHFVHYRAPGESIIWCGCFIPIITRRLEREGSKDCCGIISRVAAEVLRLLELIDTWRMWCCATRAGEKMERRPVTLLGDSAHPMLQYWRKALHGDEDAVILADKVAQDADDPARLQGYEQARYLRTAYQIMARVYGEFISVRRYANCATSPSVPTTAQTYDSIEWLYGGRTLTG